MNETNHMYLKFEDPPLDAGSSDSKHAKEIEVTSWSHGAQQNGSAVRTTDMRGTVGKATHQNISFTKDFDGSSPALYKHCWLGTQIKKVTLTCYRADGSPDGKGLEYLNVEMKDVFIASFNVGCSKGMPPGESFSLDYGSIMYNYIGLKPDGAPEGNKAVGMSLATQAPV